ncbi:MAG: NlpC/P60 family protein [Actinomycetota bacterium]
MHRSGTTPRHRWLGIASTALLLCVVAGAVAPAAPAGADPIADKKAEAERLARELELQGERVSVLAERVNQARIEADRLEGQVRTAEADLAAADARLAEVRDRLRDRAVSSYVRGRPMPMEQLLVSGSANDVAVREAYVTTVAGRERELAGALDDARERRRAERRDLDAARQAATSVLADLAGQRKAASEAAAARQATLDRVTGELGALVEAERVRRAEEEARRVQAELAARRERAAREAAAREAAAREAAAREAAAREAARRSSTTPAPRLLSPVPVPDAGDGSGGEPAAGAEAAVAEARRQLGKPYEWGASGPDSFDCSGLTSWAWRAGGRSLPHSSVAQYGATRRVDVADVALGDLLFYGSPIHHVGIYAGDGTMIEASETGTPVRVASIYRRDLVGVGRVG